VCKFGEGTRIAHPTFGDGIVLQVRRDRIEVLCTDNRMRLLVHRAPIGKRHHSP
jgi:hypothetical protein